MVRWLRWHCPPDTGFEIRALTVWGRARYLSVTEAPHNFEFFTRGWGRNICVSFKPPRPGTEPRTLAWKAAVLTTTLGPPPKINLIGSSLTPRLSSYDIISCIMHRIYSLVYIASLKLNSTPYHHFLERKFSPLLHSLLAVTLFTLWDLSSRQHIELKVNAGFNVHLSCANIISPLYCPYMDVYGSVISRNHVKAAL